MKVVRTAFARLSVSRNASADKGGEDGVCLKRPFIAGRWRHPAGASDSRMVHSRNASAAMVSRYTRVADAWGNSPLNAVWA
jgi:hypothetical protein